MPTSVVHFYDERGYDFIFFTDHNFITPPIQIGKVLVLPGVELTQNMFRCDPDMRGHPQYCFAHMNVLGVRDVIGRDPFLGSVVTIGFALTVAPWFVARSLGEFGS